MWFLVTLEIALKTKIFVALGLAWLIQYHNGGYRYVHDNLLSTAWFCSITSSVSEWVSRV